MAARGFAAEELTPSARQTFIWTPKGREIDQLANVVARKLCYRMDTSHNEQKHINVHGENIGPRDDSNAEQVESGQTVETTIQPKGKAGRPTKQAQAAKARKEATQEKRVATRAAKKSAEQSSPSVSKAKSEVKGVFSRKKGEPIPSVMPPVQIQPEFRPQSAEIDEQIRRREDLNRQIAALSSREREVYYDKKNEYDDWFLSRSDVDTQLALDVARLPPSAFIDLMTDENGKKAVIAKIMALIGKKGKK